MNFELKFTDDVVTNWQLHYGIVAEEWLGSNKVPCATSLCAPSNSYQYLNVDGILGLTHWF